MPLVAAYAASKYAIEGFSESLAHELGVFGIRVKIVQPGLAPTTSFGANSGERVVGVPAAYADYAGRFFKSMQDYATAYTTEQDVAGTIYAAATDDRDQLRYPAGADSLMLAELRRTSSEHEFIERIRAMCGDRQEAAMS